MEHISSILEYNKKFGIITSNQLLINNGKTNINIKYINKIKLIKYRMYYGNLLLLLLSMCFLSTLFLNLNYYNKVLIGVIAFVLFIASTIHEFYCYKIIIKLNNNEVHTINTTQIHKKCIKKFYYIISDKVKENKKANIN